MQIKVSIFTLSFLFQAEDGIRDVAVTGVQTCALPICAGETGPCHAKASIFLSASAHSDSDKPSAARCKDVATDGSSASRSRSVSFSDLLRAGPTETVFPLSSRMLRMGLSPSVTMCRY